MTTDHKVLKVLAVVGMMAGFLFFVLTINVPEAIAEATRAPWHFLVP